MNNTKKRTLTAIAAILMAATLVVGTAGTVTTKTAFADSNNNSGNTVTIEECKNKGSSSGFDTALDQECENLICTHPGTGATCVSEGGNATAGGGAIDPCLNCFTTNLDATEQAAFIKAAQSLGVSSLEDICRLLETDQLTVKGIAQIISPLVASGDVSQAHATALTKCLLDLGFRSK